MHTHSSNQRDLGRTQSEVALCHRLVTLVSEQHAAIGVRCADSVRVRGPEPNRDTGLSGRHPSPRGAPDPKVARTQITQSGAAGEVCSGMSDGQPGLAGGPRLVHRQRDHLAWTYVGGTRALVECRGARRRRADVDPPGGPRRPAYPCGGLRRRTRRARHRRAAGKPPYGHRHLTGQRRGVAGGADPLARRCNPSAGRRRQRRQLRRPRSSSSPGGPGTSDAVPADPCGRRLGRGMTRTECRRARAGMSEPTSCARPPEGAARLAGATAAARS